ncbi:MAG: DNA-3-methyladenine glycosylase, partial [Anaerolineae bacterium]|nr:DNA-3-methyladenine glycosylase [Anaerolineae bacterium]
MASVFHGVRLERAFYARPSVTVARELLGQRLVRVLDDGQRLSGLICETEAYGGPDDEASHAYRRTQRSAIMYGPPGHAYVYFIYGMHYCLNVVTELDGVPGAVLIRGLFPQEGLDTIRARRRGVPDARLCDGPGKVCQALGITLAQNGLDLTSSTELFVEVSVPVATQQVVITPRIGVRGSPEVRNRPCLLYTS